MILGALGIPWGPPNPPERSDIFGDGSDLVLLIAEANMTKHLCAPVELSTKLVRVVHVKLLQ